MILNDIIYDKKKLRLTMHRTGQKRVPFHYVKNSVPLLKCLTECEKGKELKIVSVEGGYHAKRRLAHLGVFPGTTIIKKNSAPWNGPVEIIVRGTSLVIGSGLASKIMVLCHDHCLN